MVLISTKLKMPLPVPDAMVRERLLSLFDSGAPARRLTAVVAPAGYGKSTLLSQWRSALLENGTPSAWINLDEEDDDPARFLAYLSYAFLEIVPSIESAVLPQLQTGPVTKLNSVAESLLSELSSCTSPFVLFLDDMHRVSNDDVHAIIDRLLDHLPDGGRVVVASRSLPKLSLSRLKVAEQLLLLGVEELGLDVDEARAFVRDVKSVSLSKDVVDMLRARTEGWFAGIQLALMGMQQIVDKEKFVAELSGSDIDITNYLGEVVLSQQTDDLQRFLLATALLERFSVDLCRAVTDVVDARSMIDQAAKNQLFLVPLDRAGEWYRYHHLFGDFLRGRALQIYPQETKSVYLKAAEWCKEQGFVTEAIQYSFLGQNYEGAAAMISDIAPELVRYRGEHATLLSWLQELPNDVLSRWPEATLCGAWSLVLTRDFEQARSKLYWLEDLCKSLDKSVDAGDQEQLAYVRLKMQLTTAVKICMLDDSYNARAAAADWVKRWPGADQFDKGVANNILGIACIGTSELQYGIESLEKASAAFRKCGAVYGVGWSEGLIGIILGTRGQLRAALDRVEEAKTKIIEALGEKSYSACFLSIILADLYYERGEILRAKENLEIGFSSALDHGILETCFAAYATRARLQFLDGELPGALTTLREGQLVGGENFSARLPLALKGEEIALVLRSGDLEAAQELAQAYGFSNQGNVVANEDSRDVTREISQLVACRISIAKGDSSTPLQTLTRIAARARKQGRNRKLAEVLILKAKANWQRGQQAQALRNFAEVLELTTDEGYYRMFLDDDHVTIREIVKAMLRVGFNDERATVDLTHLGHMNRLALSLGLVNKPAPTMLQAETMVEIPDLTKRETDLLTQIGAGLSNRDLSKRLFISEHTVKWHLGNLYRKLGVRNRTGAIAQARRLKLLN